MKRLESDQLELIQGGEWDQYGNCVSLVWDTWMMFPTMDEQEYYEMIAICQELFL